jgi:hypothetical protein
MAQFNNLTVTQKQALEIIYPIGCIYMSVLQQNPCDLFNFGEWELISDRMLVGAGDLFPIGSAGGSLQHNHGLTNAYACVETSYQYLQYRFINKSFTPTWAVLGTSNTSTPPYDASGTELGGTTDFSNTLPPFEVVYIWKRIK